MSTSEEHQRVGTAERQLAVDALNEHWKAGRLDPAEHERRTTAAYAAVTRGDLDALFTDLPGGAPVGGSTGRWSAPALVSSPIEGQVVESGSSRGGATLIPADSWAGQHRDALMGITPFVALGLFFLTRWWGWFLLIPAAGIIMYAGDDGSRKRNRRRDEE